MDERSNRFTKGEKLLRDSRYGISNGRQSNVVNPVGLARRAGRSLNYLGRARWDTAPLLTLNSQLFHHAAIAVIGKCNSTWARLFSTTCRAAALTAGVFGSNAIDVPTAFNKQTSLSPSPTASTWCGAMPVRSMM